MASWNEQKIVSMKQLKVWDAELRGSVAAAQAFYLTSVKTGIDVDAAKANLDRLLAQQADIGSDLELYTYAMNGG